MGDYPELAYYSINYHKQFKGKAKIDLNTIENNNLNRVYVKLFEEVVGLMKLSLVKSV